MHTAASVLAAISARLRLFLTFLLDVKITREGNVIVINDNQASVTFNPRNKDKTFDAIIQKCCEIESTYRADTRELTDLRASVEVQLTEIYRVFELQKGGNGKASSADSPRPQAKDDEPLKKSYKAMKYSGSGPLYESVKLAGLPQFVSFINDKLIFANSIEEPSRVLKPYEENAPEPYSFKDESELQSFIDMAKKETLDSLYRKVKRTVQAFNETDPGYITIIAADVLFSYFQDKIGTCHYLFLHGHTGSGKGSILETFSQLGYRTVLVSNATAANIYRLVGPVERGQVTILIDEANNLQNDLFIMECLKTGYKSNGMVPRIMDASSSNAEQVFYFTYGFKMIAAEHLPSESKAEGLLNRCFNLKTYPAEPKYKIDKVVNPGGDPLLQKLKGELEKLRKLLFAFRLIHYDEPINDLKLTIDGRDEELCSPLVRLFQKSEVLEEIMKTLYEFVREKREVRSEGLDKNLITMTVEILKEKKDNPDQLPFSAIWAALKDRLRGQDIDAEPQSMMTAAFGKISYRMVSQRLKKFGAKHGKDPDGNRILVFDRDRKSVV